MSPPTSRTRALAVTLSTVLVAASFVGFSLAVSAPPAAAAPSTGAATFSSNGTCSDGTYLVPEGISQIKVIAEGAVGGDGEADPQGEAGGTGGPGSEVQATVNVSPGEVLNVNVADPFSGTFTPGSGYGGPPGGATNEGPVNVGGYGGNASWISTSTSGDGCAPALSSLLVVAAGGGGGGGAATFAPGGSGGNETGTASGGNGGSNHQDDGAGGSAASLTTAGSGGAAGHNSDGLAGCRAGEAGGDGLSLDGGYGGNGGSDPAVKSGCQGVDDASGSGGGGGAGYFGGGGGGGGDDNADSGAAAGGGGGAGVSYIISGATATSITRAYPGGDQNQFAGTVSIVPVDTPPVIISTNTFTFQTGKAIPSTAMITATGWPVPQISLGGDSPSDVFPQDNNDGTTTFTGTPDANAYGVHAMTVTATNTDGNGQVHQATQPITVIVDNGPKFQSSSDTTAMVVGTAASYRFFVVDAYPEPTMGVTGTLPPGISVKDNGDGSATLTGTPTGGGVFPVTLTSSNGFGTTATEALTITVTPIPTTLTVTSSANPSTSGQAVTFSAAITPNFGNSSAVDFYVDGSTTAIVVTPNSAGIASLPPISNLAVGVHTVKAEYNTSGFQLSSSGSLIQHVGVTTATVSGTTLTGSPATTSLWYADNRIRQHLPQADVDTGIDAGGPIAIGPTGTLYTVDDGRLAKGNGAGSYSEYGPTLGAVQGLAVDAAGNVYVAQFNTSDGLIKVAPDGTSTVLLNGGGSTIFEQDSSYLILGDTIDAAGNLFVTDGSDGAHVMELSPPYTAPPTVVPVSMSTPQEIAVDSHGDLFVNDTYAKKVYEVSPATGVQTTIASGISGLQSIAVDSSGDLYFGTTTTLYEVTPPYTGAPFIVESGHSFAGLATQTAATAAAGQTVTLTASTVSSPAGPYPAGTVTFAEGSTVLGTATADADGNATLALSNLSVGFHVITATYGGNTIYPASTSDTFGVSITLPLVPVTVTGTRSFGSSTVSYTATTGTLPGGVTGTSGTLTGCATSTSTSSPLGFYTGTMGGCSGLALTGASAASYQISYIDGGVTVTQGIIPVTVTGNMVVGGSVNFSSTNGTLPSGITLTGTLAGCASTVPFSAAVGSYPGTISGCTGLSPTGTSASSYTVSYVDGGVTVALPAISVTVTGAKPYGGGVATSFSYSAPTILPTGITLLGPVLTGCASTVGVTTAVGIHQNTISGCAGLVLEGGTAANYRIVYVDGGVTVTARSVTFVVTATQPLGGTPTFRYGQDDIPTDVSYIEGTLSGCQTTLTTFATPGSYPSTISGCTGLVFGTSDGVTYPVAYVDGGVTVGALPTSTSLVASPSTLQNLIVGGNTSQIASFASPYNGSYSTLSTGSVARTVALGVTSTGSIIVADQHNADSYLDVLTPSGALVSSTLVPGGLVDIAVDSRDNVIALVGDDFGSSVVEWSAPYTGTPTTLVSNLRYAYGIALDKADNLFIADDGGDVVSELPAPYSGVPAVIYQTAAGVSALAVDAADNLYLATINGSEHIIRVAPPYTGTATVVGGSLESEVTHMAFDRLGNLFYVAEGGEWELKGNTNVNFNYSFAGGMPSGLGFSPVTTTVDYATPVTLTATVGSTSSAAPGGTVTFYDGSSTLGSASIVGSTATLTTTTLAPGAHNIVASYQPTSSFAASSSSTQVVTVGQEPISFVPPNAATVGQTAALSASSSVSQNPVTFTVDPSTSPAGACTLSGTNSDIVTYIHVGTCVLDANQLPDAGDVAPPTAMQSVAISPATLTMTASDASMVYGAAPPSVTASYSGFQNGDTDAVVTTAASCSADPVARATSCTGAVAADYTIVAVPGVLTVTPATLTVTASAGTMVYGGSLPTITPSYSGFVNGDSSSHVTTAPTCVADPVTRTTSCTGGAAADYTLVQVPGVLTVTPATLTVTASAGTMVYGGSLPTITPSYSGFVNGDSRAHVTTAPTCVADPVTRTTGCAGGAAADYTLVQVPGVLTVTPATLTVTASDGTMVYGGSLPTITPSYSGFVNGDIASHVTTAPTCVADPVTRTTSCAGGAAADYTLVQVPGVLTVTPATLTVTASDGTMVYGGSLPTITPTYSGFVNGDTSSHVTTAPTCVASPVAKTTDCTGGVAADYTLVPVAGQLTVTPASLTITASNSTLVYGGVPSAVSAQYSGFVNGDDASDLASAPVCSADQTTMTTTCVGAASPDYTIATVDGVVSEIPAPLKITAPSLSIVRGGAIPSLPAKYSGFVSGETPSSLTLTAACTTTATSSSPVGSYPTTCKGAQAANYAIHYVSGMLTVTAPAAGVSSPAGPVTAPQPSPSSTPTPGPTVTRTPHSSSPRAAGPTTSTGPASWVLPFGLGVLLLLLLVAGFVVFVRRRRA
jgi:hypothetical protein